MLARFLLAVLMALVSMPVMACEPAPPPPAHHGMQHHGPAAPDRHHADAACIGCIAPSTIPSPALAAPLAYPPLPPVAAASTGAAFGRARPATPPPRNV